MAKPISIAVIGKNVSQRNLLQSSVLLEIPHSVVSQASSVANLMERKDGPYQAVIVDDSVLKDKRAAIRDIAKKCERGPRVIVVSNQQTPFSEYRGLNGLILGQMVKENGQLSEQEVRTVLADSKNEGAFDMNLSIGFYGASGDDTHKAVKNLVQSGKQTFWYSPRLSGKSQLDKVGYRAFAQSKDISWRDNLTCFSESDSLNGKGPGIEHGGIEQLVAANPDVIICASAVRNGQAGLVASAREGRYGKDHLIELYKNGKRRIMPLIKEMVRQHSTSKLGILTNPPEWQARLAVFLGIDPENIFTVSADGYRLVEAMGDKIDESDNVFIVGTHDSPKIRTELFTRDMYEKFYKGILMRERASFADCIEKTVGNWGLSQRIRSVKYGISSEDVGNALAKDFNRVSRFQQPVSWGYYMPVFGVHMYGPKPLVDKELRLHPDVYNPSWEKMLTGKVHDELNKISEQIRNKVAKN
jgi:hypothetical protein